MRNQGRVYIPAAHPLRTELLIAFHDAPTSGHLGILKVMKQLSSRYYWYGMRQQVKDYISTCAVCQRTKPRHYLSYGQLASLPIPSRPLEEIFLDFITKLPKSISPDGRNCDSILVVVCRLTKYALHRRHRLKILPAMEPTTDTSNHISI